MHKAALPVAAMAIFFSPLPAAAAPPEATAYQITVDHAGVTTSGGVLAPQPSVLWSAALPGAISYPLIAGGKVFVTTAGLPGSTYGTQLWAFDAQTGKALWGPVALSGTYFWSNATYEAGKLFVVNFDGLVRTYDATTGAPGWSAQLSQYSFSSPPTASGGIVYIGGSGGGGTLYALNESNGAVLWTASVWNGDHSSPAIGPGGVYVSYPCQVYDFDPVTGALNWRYNGGCEGGGGKTPVYANGALYVRDPPNATIYDAASGTAVRNFTAGPVPAIGATTGFFLSSGTLAAVDLATTHQQWAFAGDGSLITAPLVIDQSVIVGSSSGNLYALDTSAGTVTWQVKAPAGIAGPDEQNVSQPLTGLAVADGILVVPATDTLIVYSILAGPGTLVATGQAGAVNLSWTAGPAGTSSYNLYMGSSASSESTTPLLTGITGTSTTLTNLSPGTTYFFTVRAVSSAGISVPSNEASAASRNPAAPASLTATAGVGSVTLSWGGSADAKGYDVYVGTAAGAESSTPAMTGVSTTSTTVSGLTAGTSYYFTVKAVAFSAHSAASNEASATPMPPASQGAGAGGGGATEWLSLLLLGACAAWRVRRAAARAAGCSGDTVMAEAHFRKPHSTPR